MVAAQKVRCVTPIRESTLVHSRIGAEPWVGNGTAVAHPLQINLCQLSAYERLSLLMNAPCTLPMCTLFIIHMPGDQPEYA